jgi:hypothetical protein
MARAGIRYRLSDSRILAAVIVANDQPYESNYDAETEGLIEIVADHPALTALDRYRVVEGALAEKIAVTCSATKATIAADGVDESVVTFVGLTAPVSVEVNRTPVALTVEDPAIAITSDVAMRFVLCLRNDPLHALAVPGIVEAV